MTPSPRDLGARAALPFCTPAGARVPPTGRRRVGGGGGVNGLELGLALSGRSTRLGCFSHSEGD
eukprot:gene8855-biopygen125